MKARVAEGYFVRDPERIIVYCPAQETLRQKSIKKGTVGNEEESDLIKENYSLWRLMIDKKYEEQGFGRQTIDSAMDLIRTFPFGKAQKVWLSYEPENTHACSVYEQTKLNTWYN